MEKIPAVPGFVLYRADNKQLYYNKGSKWQAISNKIEVSSENRTRAVGSTKIGEQDIYSYIRVYIGRKNNRIQKTF